jgi:hypothetical protein
VTQVVRGNLKQLTFPRIDSAAGNTRVVSVQAKRKDSALDIRVVSVQADRSAAGDIRVVGVQKGRRKTEDRKTEKNEGKK